MMNNETSNNVSPLALAVKQAILGWDAQVKNVTAYFNKYNDELYLEEVAPGRNRAVYLFGHLIAANDFIFPILGKGEKMYPELEPVFISGADRAFESIPSLEELRQMWEAQKTALSKAFTEMQPEEWFERHTRVSQEDFEKEPHRNKFNILLSRTTHTAYHVGQLALLKGEEVVA